MLKQSAEQRFFFSQQMLMNMSYLQMNKVTLDLKIEAMAEENPFIKHESFRDLNRSHKTVLPEIIEQTLATQKTLYENLREEFLLDFEEEDLHLIQLIIGNTDRFGFLTISVKDLCYGTSLDEGRLEFVRKKIMSSADYMGLGTYNQQEYLSYITERIYGRDSIEFEIVKLIAQKKVKSANTIQRHLKHPLKDISSGLEKINLLPKSPLQEETIAILPDIIVKIEDGEPVISSIEYGRTIINTEINTDDLNYQSKELKNFKKEALNIKKALEIRHSALDTYASLLIKARRDYFVPDIGQKPVSITLKSIAEETNRNVSTVSRALKDRYFLFDGRIIPFSDLLTRELGNSNSFEIKKHIKTILDQESHESPLTDGIIVDILAKKGIKIARRTVAKYREQLHIGSVYQR
ncbi:MAG: hypothetical protein ACRCS8_01840 [Brevinema sp.]